MLRREAAPGEIGLHLGVQRTDQLVGAMRVLGPAASPQVRRERHRELAEQLRVACPARGVHLAGE